MKKLLGIVVLGLLWCGPVIAGCADFLDFSWKFIGKDRVTHVSDEHAHYAKFTFKSSSDKTIRINFVRLITADGKIVKKKEYVDFYIKPYGKDSDLMDGMKSLNLDVVTSGGYSCRFENQPAKKTSTTNSNKSNNTEESPVLVLLVVFAIIGYIIYKFSNSKEKKSNRKIAKENNVPDAEILSKDEIKEKYKIIAKFYNNYKIIDYGKISNKKIAQKQMEDIVNVVDKNLAILSAGTENTPYRMLIVGIVTFKLTTKEQVIKVHNDLKKMYKKGKLLEFDDRLMTALENILDDNAGIDY